MPVVLSPVSWTAPAKVIVAPSVPRAASEPVPALRLTVREVD